MPSSNVPIVAFFDHLFTSTSQAGQIANKVKFTATEATVANQML